MTEISSGQRSMLRAIPAIHRLIQQPLVKRLGTDLRVPHELIVDAAGQVVTEWREQILNGTIQMTDDLPLLDQISRDLHKKITEWLLPRLRRVINGTGVVLHTNLGRALLGETAINQVMEAAAYYSNLEYDIEDGQRGSRHSHVEELICRLTGAEGAMVVNNNAAAVYLILRGLAKNKEVVVSRGQLVEIGGSFRVSEIMAESGAKLVEVGTSNKTHLYDYERVVHEETALLLKVHTSNFRTIGFTSSVSTRELAELGAKHQIPVYEDLGSGVLYDLRPYGIGDEPLVQEVIEAGADLVSFSGDKLLGGPQAGIIAGKKKWIDRLKKHQLARILRVDKMTLAGLEATLRLYLLPERARQEIPALRDILIPIHEIEEKAQRFVEKVGTDAHVHLNLIDDESAVGGGTLPGITLPTKAVALEFQGQAAHHVEEKLRLGTPPVIVRVVKDQVRIDFRTIMQEEIDLLAEAVRKISI
ncbi:L-seryl-tRNA(Sec) selenium transferase [Paenibacillus filicis]|uniref:L-seryl-tRNA(Sec) selenium transferase n=1 Tax=Paenibacillus gyeongsangnamensis TaxID=3388067 RepID=A0ABT4QJD2_9BACL|nr:L-seryl-tRNA(Sec) selenium transferase [Paenibacillus filicis]MCZ8516975.1 L-seryl-tRNA(Sec) selenium transferase [Paenibacillus filicis]